MADQRPTRGDGMAVTDVADAVFAIRTAAPVVPLPGDTPLDLLGEES